MTAFEKWNGFIQQLIYLDCPADNEKARLQAELALIEKTGCAQLFQAIYDTWQSLLVNGVRCFLTGGAAAWYIFRFLDMTRENPLGKALSTGGLAKVAFVVPQGVKEKAERFAQAHKLPENRYEIVVE